MSGKFDERTQQNKGEVPTMRHLISILVVLLALTVVVAPASAKVVKVSDNVGGGYEVDEFKEEVKVFTDRDHIFNEVPAKYVGATYIRCPVSSVRGGPDVDITVEIDAPSQVYILWYHEDRWDVAGKPAGPTDWLEKDYEKTDDLVVWGPDIKFTPWKSREVFLPGEFHTYATGNDCAYGIFLMEATAPAAVHSASKLSTSWAEIKTMQKH